MKCQLKTNKLLGLSDSELYCIMSRSFKNVSVSKNMIWKSSTTLIVVKIA